MSSVTGFLKYDREDPPKRPVEERVKDFHELEMRLPLERLKTQASRCMDCGIPYCHAFGCPLGNLIPDFNDMVYRGHWELALELLHSTNNFPEITGRVCPAPCEAACTLSINQSPVTIRNIELEIAEHGWEQGWIHPEKPSYRTGKKVAIVGSGPAGLAAAQQLVRSGHEVIVFEKDSAVGGLLRYGIPDFKLEKWVIDRRIEQMQSEGVVFEIGVEAGLDISARYMKRSFDAILITTGARVPRDLNIPGRNLTGIHFALEFLKQQNRINNGETIPPEERITAAGKNVVVIGGGDTGSDCVGTSRRQGAKQITQIELLPEPPKVRKETNPWPTWLQIMRTSSSQEEGCNRLWSILTKKFIGKDNRVKKLSCVKLEWEKSGAFQFREMPGSEFEIEADLVLLATGFIHTEHGPLVKDIEIDLDNRGNIIVDSSFMTSKPGIFAAGDSVLGPSLVVKAINHGRLAARGIDYYLRVASQ